MSKAKNPVAALRREIKKNIANGMGIATVSSAAIRTLGLTLGVQGSDRDDYIEIWDHASEASGPFLAISANE